MRTQATINWNGSVDPCCAVWHESFDFGSIINEPFKKIWNNEKYTNARKIIRGKKIIDNKNICYICNKNSAMIV